jgi:hypothetical protein
MEAYMNFDRNHINNAIVNALADLLDDDSRYSAKTLQNTIAVFFFEAAGTTGSENKGPEGYCYPWQADLASLTRMCEAIFASVRNDATCRHSQIKLIRKMYGLSESYMARFRQERAAGTYTRNTGYIYELSPDNDWGRWMIALRGVFHGSR